MYEKVEDEDRSQLVDHLKPKAAEKPEKSDNFEALLEEAMEGLVTVHHEEEKSEVRSEIEHQNDMRKIFQGPFQNFEPTLAKCSSYQVYGYKLNRKKKVSF